MFKIIKNEDGKFNLVDQKIATHKVVDERVKPLLEAFVKAMNNEGEYNYSPKYSVKPFHVVVEIKGTISINIIVRRIQEPWYDDKIEVEILPGKGYNAYEMNRDLFKGSSSFPGVFRKDSWVYSTIYDAGNGTILTYRISLIDLAYHAFGYGGWYLKYLTT